MRIFGIPVSPAFYYLWSMSLAQVELMCADCSITVYPKIDTVKGHKGKEYKFNRPSVASLMESKKEFDKWTDVVNPTVDISGFFR